MSYPYPEESLPPEEQQPVVEPAPVEPAPVEPAPLPEPTPIPAEPDPGAYTAAQIEEPIIAHRRERSDRAEALVMARDQRTAAAEQKAAQREEDRRARDAQKIMREQGVEMEIGPDGQPQPRRDIQGRILYKPEILNPFELDEKGNPHSRRRNRFGQEQLTPLKPKTDEATGEKYVIGEDGVTRFGMGVDETFVAKKQASMAREAAKLAEGELTGLNQREKAIKKRIESAQLEAGMLAGKKNPTDAERVRLAAIQSENARDAKELTAIAQQRAPLAQQAEQAKAAHLNAAKIALAKQQAEFAKRFPAIAAKAQKGEMPVSVTPPLPEDLDTQPPPPGLNEVVQSDIFKGMDVSQREDTLRKWRDDTIAWRRKFDPTWNKEKEKEFKGQMPDRAGVLGWFAELGAGIKAAILDRFPEDIARVSRQFFGPGKIPLVDNSWQGQWIAEQEADRKARGESIQTLSGNKWNEAAQQGPQSVVTSAVTSVPGAVIGGKIGAGIGAVAGAPAAGVGAAPGAVIGGTIGAAIGAAATTGPVFYAMAKDSFVEQVRDMILAKGIPMDEAQWSKIQDDIESEAKKYGYWEAGPEMLSNAFTAGLFKGGGKILGAAIGKAGLEKLSKNAVAGVLAKYGGEMAEELSTETLTGVGQGGIEAKVGLREKAPGWIESFKDVAGPTAVGALLQGGAMHAAAKIEETIKNKVAESRSNEAAVKAWNEDNPDTPLTKEAGPVVRAVAKQAYTPETIKEWEDAGKGLVDLIAKHEEASAAGETDVAAAIEKEIEQATRQQSGLAEKIQARQTAAKEAVAEVLAAPAEDRPRLVEMMRGTPDEAAIEAIRVKSPKVAALLDLNRKPATTTTNEPRKPRTDGHERVPDQGQAEDAEGQKGQEEVPAGDEDAQVTTPTVPAKKAEAQEFDAWAKANRAEAIAHAKREDAAGNKDNAAAIRARILRDYNEAKAAKSTSSVPPTPKAVPVEGPALLVNGKPAMKGGRAFTHAELIQQSAKLGEDLTDAEHGFHDAEGKPLTRIEAAERALAAGQIDRATYDKAMAREGKDKGLHSQDLHEAAPTEQKPEPAATTTPTPAETPTQPPAAQPPSAGAPAPAKAETPKASSTDSGKPDRTQALVNKALEGARVRAVLDALGVKIEKGNEPASFRATFTAGGFADPRYVLKINEARIAEKTAGMDDDAAAAYVEAAIGEEIIHFGQYEAVKLAWQARNRRNPTSNQPEPFETAFAREYNAVREAMTDAEVSAVREAYGSDIDGPNLGAEFVRQLIQTGLQGQPTEATIRAKPIIERLLAVLRDLLDKIANAPKALREAHDRTKAVLDGIEAAGKKPTESSKSPGAEAWAKVRAYLNAESKSGRPVGRFSNALDNIGKRHLDPTIDNDLSALLRQAGVEDVPLSFEGAAYENFWQDFSDAMKAKPSPDKVGAAPPVSTGEQPAAPAKGKTDIEVRRARRIDLAKRLAALENAKAISGEDARTANNHIGSASGKNEPPHVTLDKAEAIIKAAEQISAQTPEAATPPVAPPAATPPTPAAGESGTPVAPKAKPAKKPAEKTPEQQALDKAADDLADGLFAAEPSGRKDYVPANATARRRALSRFASDLPAELGTSLEILLETEPAERVDGGGTAQRPDLERGILRDREALGALENALRVNIVPVTGKGLTFDGFQDPNQPGFIFIDANGAQPPLAIIGHEFSHHLETVDPRTYGELLGDLRPQFTNLEVWEAIQEKYAAEVREKELVAELMGEQMADPSFWEELSTRNPALFDRVATAVRKWLNGIAQKLRGFESGIFIKDINAVRTAITKAVHNHVERGGTDGLAAAEPIEQKPIPPEKAPQLVTFAVAMLKADIRTAEGVANYLEEKFKGKARAYTRSIWEMMGAVGGERGEQDWSAIYSAIDAAATEDTQDTAVAENVKNALLRGETVDRRALSAMKPEGMTDKEADEQAELGIVLAARVIATTSISDEEKFDRMLDLYNRQPNLTAKTSTSKVNQAYSTPVPLGFLASRLAQIEDTHVVQEDTAGNGMLLMEADPKKALVNELDPQRAAHLREQGFTVTEEDATTIAHDKKADRLNTNPPFGTVKDEGVNRTWPLTGTDKATTQIDHAISLKSLANLKDDGRAVLIIGGTQAIDPTARRQHYAQGERGDFFAALYGQYKVVDHFTVDGDLYRKQGAGWPVDVIVIAGRGPSPIQLPTQQPPRILKTWDELRKEVTRTDEDRINSGQYDEARDRDELGGSIAGIRAALEGGKRPGGQGNRPQPPSQTDTGTDDSGFRVDSGTPPAANPGEQVLQPSAGAESGVGDGSTERSGDDRSDDGLKVEKPKEPEKPQFHKPYVPVSEGNSFGIETPANLAEPQRLALEAIEQKVGKPLREYVREKLGYGKDAPIDKYFAAEQLDAIASAIYNIEHGGALILGDMTGVGKGRVVAALIEYAKRMEMTPIFVTKNPTLYSAMLGDFHNIGRTVQPFYTNNDLDISHPITNESIRTKVQRPFFEEILRTGRLPAKFDAVFTTYDQIGKINDPTESKESRRQAIASGGSPRPGLAVQALLRLARGTGEVTSPKGKALVLLDESHLGAGASSQGIRVRSLIQNARVYYSSATFAKRPDAMPLYFKTNLRKAAPSMNDLMAVFATGGVVMQQVTSQMLAQDGQYIRRERTFDGVPFETRINFETEERDRGLANEYTRGLRTILDMSNRIEAATDSMNAIMARLGKRMSVPVIRMESADFASQIHNFVKQYLFAIKAEAAAQQAIQAIKEGHQTQDGTTKRHKVIIAVENTMESPIRTLDDAGMPLKFGSLLERTLNGLRVIKTGGSVSQGTATYFTVRREPDPQFRNATHDDLVAQLVIVRTVTGADGNPMQVGTVNEPVANEIFRRLANQQFLDAEEEIRQLDLGDMPLSPIDYIRQRAEAQGIRTGEITGRSVGIDANGKTYARDSSDISKKGQLATLAAFNHEDLDLMVINASGSTGVSAHADENFRNKAPRMMIVAQPHLDINEFMQTLGRIFRSGQVEKPRYQLLQTALPAEKRPAAILGKKMASLNANTTSNADSQVSQGASVVDIFNEYGDGVVWAWLRENPAFVRALQWDKIVTGPNQTLLPLSDIMETLEEDGKLARGVSSYASILSVEEQEVFWEDVINRYHAQIAYLDQIGENKLKASADDLGAEMVKSEIFTAGDPNGDSAFDAPSRIETVNVKPKTLPMEPGEVREQARVAAAGRSKLISDYRTQASQWTQDYLAKRKEKAIGDWSTIEPRERERLQGQYNFVFGQLQKLGKLVQVQTASGQKIGAVIGVELDEESPLTPSKQIFVVAVNTLRRTLKIPGSQMAETVSEMDADQFEERYEATREDKVQRQIVTGNLVAAAAKLKGNGAITRFTRADGSIETGILLPINFSLAQLNSEQVHDEDHAMQLLRDSIEVSADDGRVRLYMDAGNVMLSVPSSRAAGGKYWQDKRLTDAMKRAVMNQRGALMIGEVDDLQTVIALFRNTFNQPLSYARPDTGSADAPEPLALEAPEPLSQPTQEIHELKRQIQQADTGGSIGTISAERQQAQAESLKTWAEKSGKLTSAAALDRLSGDNELEGGEEHDVWYDPGTNRVLKLTRQTDGWGNATDLEYYLNGLAFGNEEFGDDYRIEGVVEQDGWPHILISQPFYRGRKATDAEIDAYFKERGYRKIQPLRYFNEATGITVWDAKGPNVLMLADGRMMPMDVQIDPRDFGYGRKIGPQGQLWKRTLEAAEPNGPGGQSSDPTAQYLKSALAELPATERRVLVMRAKGDAIEEIVRATGLSERGVENAYQIALGKMRLAREKAATVGEVFRQAVAEKEGARTIGRPQLANPASGPLSRRMVDVTDELRKQEGVPLRKADEAVIQEADERMQGRGYDRERRRIFEAAQNGEQLNDVDTVIARKIVAREALRAVKSGDANRLYEAASFINAYRITGTEQARAFRQRRDWTKSPAERLQEYVAQAILTPPKKMRDRLDDTKDTGERERILKDWVRQMNRLKKQLKHLGLDLENMTDEEISAWLSNKTRATRAVRAIAAAKADAWDALYEYWISSILSAPPTQIANLFGNAGNAAWDFTAQRMAEAMVNLAVGDPNSAQVGEFAPMLRAILPGLQRGSRNFLMAWRTETPVFEEEVLGEEGATKLEDASRAAIGGGGLLGKLIGDANAEKTGRVIRTPLRLLVAVDEFSKSLIGQMQAAAVAYRIAKAEGLTGAAQRSRIDALMEPGSVAWEEAVDKAKQLAFQEEMGRLGKAVVLARSGTPGLRYFVPFVVTVANIFKTAIRKTPLGSVALLYRMSRQGAVQLNWDGSGYRYTRKEFVPHAAEQLLAWTVFFALRGLVEPDDEDDLPTLTGTVPYEFSSRGARDLAYRTAPPMSVKIGGQWFSYARIEPFATAIGVMVDGLNKLRETKNGLEHSQALADLFKHLTAQVKDKTFARGIGDILNAIEDGTNTVEWAGNFATSWVPNLIRATASESDDMVREQKVWGRGEEWADRLKERLAYKAMPLESNAPEPKVDLWGREIQKDKHTPGTDLAWRLLFPMRTQPGDKVLEVDRLLTNWGNQNPNEKFAPQLPAPSWTKTLNGQRRTIYMSDGEYNAFLQMAGRTALGMLDAQSLNIENPTRADLDKIEDALEKARKGAREAVWQDRVKRVLGNPLKTKESPE